MWHFLRNICHIKIFKTFFCTSLRFLVRFISYSSMKTRNMIYVQCKNDARKKFLSEMVCSGFTLLYRRLLWIFVKFILSNLTCFTLLKIRKNIIYVYTLIWKCNKIFIFGGKDQDLEKCRCQFFYSNKIRNLTNEYH